MSGKQLSIYLNEAQVARLTEISIRECRRVNDQARYFILNALELAESEKIEFGHLGEGAQILDPHLGVFLKPEVIHIGANSRIDCVGGKFEGGQGLHIGAGVHISARVHLNVGGGLLTICDYAAVTTGACIITGSNTKEGRAMSSASPREMQVIERKTVVIGTCAMVAAHAVVLPGVTIGAYAVVGAGAVVTKDVPDYAVVFGIPAQVVGDRRDMEGWDYD